MTYAIQKQDFIDEPRETWHPAPSQCRPHTNPRGDIFGGWIMGLMDSAASMTAASHAEGRSSRLPCPTSLLQPVRG